MGRAGRYRIPNIRRHDKNEKRSVLIMNKVQSQPRPVPKPRAQNSPSPSSGIMSTSLPSRISSSPSKKPPTKPKPLGYKSLNFNNKGLVTISAEIDIGDGSSTLDTISSGDNQTENNNIVNLKKGNKKGSAASPNNYNKPLPPLPSDISSLESKSQGIINADNQEEKLKIAINQYSGQLPAKPKRLHISASEGQLQTLKCELGDLIDRSVSPSTPMDDKLQLNKRNPPVPRKPTALRGSNQGVVQQYSSHSPLRSSLKKPTPDKADSDNKVAVNGKHTPLSLTEPTKSCHSSEHKMPDKLNTSVGRPVSSSGIDRQSKETASHIRTPPLPQKPTMLLRSSETETSQECCTSNPPLNNIDFSEQTGKNVNNMSASEDIVSSKKPDKRPTSSSDSNQRRSNGDPRDTLGKQTLSPTESNNKDMGHTPPLPRKPLRKLSPAMEIHFKTVNTEGNSSEQQSSNSSEQGSVGVRTSNEFSSCSKQSDSRPMSSGSSSPPDLLQRNAPSRAARRTSASNETCDNSGSEQRMSSSLGKDVVDSSNPSCTTPENSGTESDVRENHKIPSARNIRRPPEKGPSRPPPNLPVTSPKKTDRRKPPNLPKQPSVSKRAPPPLPQVPRPQSVIPNLLIPRSKFPRSRSAENIAENGDDETYWVAYQHLRQNPSNSNDSNVADEDEYVSPDKDVMDVFMESIKSKSRNNEKSGPINKGRAEKPRDVSTAYSSSSDDCSHEYEDIDAARSLSKETAKNSLSSARSDDHEYVETIHYEDMNKGSENTRKDSKKISEASNKKLEFKPFENMDGEWSQPKVINWEYEGESDDSDVSYIEPDEGEDDDLFGEEEEEPLYQIYQANVLEKERTLSLRRHKKDSVAEVSPKSPGGFTLRSGTLRGGKMLWSQLPEVRNSGILDNIAGEQRKLQEAIFEVISSEASYLKSLHLLVDHFMSAKVFSTDSIDSILSKSEVSQLFTNIKEIVSTSERFLDDLRTRQRQSILIESISDIITEHATNSFQTYVTYCSTQYKQDRMLSDLRKTNVRFAETLYQLERDSRVFGLTLQSFLVLPMQRVTRYPLLVDAIVRRCHPGRDEYYKTDAALKAVNQVVHKCNEGARKEERYEEMLQIEKQISFLKMKPIKLVTKDRWLLRRGSLQLLELETKSTLTNTLRGKFRKYRTKPIYLFLFNDLLVVTKKKSEISYSVIDFANRNMIRVRETKANTKNSFMLVFLENFEKKTKELNFRADNETDLTRWKEAFEPPEAQGEDEKIYGTWDCPQVHAIHSYQAQQSDELSLVPGDVVNVLRKLSDGWYEGERIRDGMCGWFPANHTEEIRNEHVRARNLHQRYRLLAASTAFLDTRKR